MANNELHSHVLVINHVWMVLNNILERSYDEVLHSNQWCQFYLLILVSAVFYNHK